MKKNVQYILIILVIAVTFLGSAFLFWTVYIQTQRSAVEAETNLYSSLLADDIENGISSDTITSGKADHTLSTDLNRIKEKTENHDEKDIWIVGADKQIYYDHIGSVQAYSEDRLQQEITEPTMLKEADTEGVAIRWAGGKGGILPKQHCIVTRPIYDGSMFLVVSNHANSSLARQRKQLAFMLVIEGLLMLIMLVLVVNLVSKYRRELIRIATTDELTNLANRKSFHEEFQEYVQSDTRPIFSLFLLDIDYFKQINDNHGHAAGDHALRHLAGMISELTKKTGGFAGRWGGDEFIGVLPLDGRQAQARLRELCGQVEASELEDGLHMTISAGVVEAGKETRLTKLSELADIALYVSKENGRNQATKYKPDMAGAAADVKTVDRVRTNRDGVVHNTMDPETSEESTQGKRGEDPSDPEKRELFRKRISGYLHEKLFRSIILGVRWMAPFVAGGGILIALAFLFDAASVDLASLPVSERAKFGSITPQAAILKNLGGTTFDFMLPVFAGFMAFGLAGEEAFMTGFVGGFMTINSNSGFIGAMIAGLVAGIITNEVHQFTNRLPKVIKKAAPIIIFPVFNLLLMQLVSYLIITPVSNAVGQVFKTLLDYFVETNSVSGGVLSGMMMAVDMGGIVNKVAYNYGVNGLQAGHTDIMASVMIGGMVPPIGIALSMLLFKTRYTEEERDRGLGTMFMGLSFITEGALPFVFTDFLRVIPSCMLGSAIAGGLSMLFGCTLPAPHGGMFVFPVMGHPILYILALAAGSLTCAVVLGKSRPKGRREEDSVTI